MKKSSSFYLKLFVIVIFGIAISTSNINADDTRWYFNTAKNIQGPYNSPGDCERQLEDYIKKNNLTAGSAGACEQKTTTEAEAIKASQTNAPVPISSQAPVTQKKTIYRLLAPIPGLTCIDDTGSDKNCVKGGIGEYLNIIFKIGIGLCGVLAVVMLVINFIGYMSSESFTEKANFKQKFWGPIGGLLLALGAYAILTTINPALTGKEGLTIDQVGVTVEEFNDMPEGGDLSEPIIISNISGGSGGGADMTTGIKCASGSATQGFCMFGTIDNPKPTGEIPLLINHLKSGYKLTKISIVPIPGAKNEKFVFTATKGSEVKQFSTMGIGHGANGFSLPGQGREGDKKTPYGSFKIDRPPRKAPNQMTVIRSTRTDKSGVGYSMGGAVFNLNSRGIAIHSNRKNSLGNSAACILMHNDDLFALYPYIWVGLPVVIGP